MDSTDLYDEHDRERLVEEPPKRVEAPERTPYERDRARVVHAAASRRLAAKTQVHGPQMDDFVRNRLTHSLEVAQVARDLSRALGSQPDIAETAALAHDLGPPAVRPQRRARAARAGRAVRRLRGQRADAAAADPAGGQDRRRIRRVGRAQPHPGDAGRLHQVPVAAVTGDSQVRGVRRRPAGLRAGSASGAPRRGTRRCVEAQIMDLADDVAYSVHDVEDGVVAERVDLAKLDRPAIWDAVRAWYLPEADDDAMDAALSELTEVGSWPRRAVRRVEAQPRRAEEPHQRPHRPLLRRRAGGHLRGGRRAVRALPRRPRGPRAQPRRDGSAQGDRRPLRHAGRRPGRADDPSARAGLGAGRGPGRARARPRSSGRSRTTGTPRRTTPPGCGS